MLPTTSAGSSSAQSWRRSVQRRIAPCPLDTISATEHQPTSIDGRYLAALNLDSTKLLLFDFKTQRWSDSITEPGAVGYVNWSRDGSYLYYDGAFTGHPTFRRIKVGQTHSEPLVDLKGLSRYLAPPAYGWSGVAPDGSALFTRDLSTDEIYALDLDLP